MFNESNLPIVLIDRRLKDAKVDLSLIHISTPGICPIYILSTMLYRALTSWAMVMGMVSLIKRGRIFAPAS